MTKTRDLATLGGGFTQTGTGAVQRSVESKLKDVVSVKDFGAVGDGVANDTAAIQAAINYFRTRVEAIVGQAGCVTLSLAGGVFRVTSSLDLTGISTWGWAVEDGTIIGECSGKAVLDMTGSRGGKVSNVVVYGSTSPRPRVGIQSARSAAGGQEAFCDNMYFENVSVHGYFSLAAVYFYGQETTTHHQCQYWNYNENGYAGIHAGYNFEAYQSDYATAITGDTSYINNKYINVDWRYIPADKIATITGVTRANPAVVTVPSHPFVNGDTVVISGISTGMTQLNNTKAVVANATPTSFELTGVNSSAYSVWTAGGTVVKAQTKSTILFGRGQQQSFDTCYVVNYGTDSIRYFSTPTFDLNTQITFDFLFEGAGSTSHVIFDTSLGTISPKLFDFVFKTYNTHCRDYIFRTDTGGSETVSFYGGKISVTNHSYSNPTLLDTPSEYSFYGCEVLYPSRAGFAPANTISYRGTYVASDDGVAEDWNKVLKYSNNISPTWTPTVSSESGSITSYTSSGIARQVGDMVFVSGLITITNNGTGANSIVISNLPVAASSNGRSVLVGRENAVTGSMLQGLVNFGTTVVNFRTYNNAYPGATNAQISFSGWYYVGP